MCVERQRVSSVVRVGGLCRPRTRPRPPRLPRPRPPLQLLLRLLAHWKNLPNIVMHRARTHMRTAPASFVRTQCLRGKSRPVSTRAVHWCCHIAARACHRARAGAKPRADTSSYTPHASVYFQNEREARACAMSFMFASSRRIQSRLCQCAQVQAFQLQG
jgi:hypothetical protein